MKVQSYRDLMAWQKSMDLVVEIYKLSKLFPRDEQFGLISQIRRSTVSIPANIAEGQGRLHRAEFLRFLSIARGSLTETETHLLIALRLGYLNREQAKSAWALCRETGRILYGLIKSLESNAQSIASNGKISELSETYEVDANPDDGPLDLDLPDLDY